MFLQTTPSSNPDVPFQAGQRINVPRLTPELQQWIRAGHAELVREAGESTTDVPTPERAVTKAKKR